MKNKKRHTSKLDSFFGITERSSTKKIEIFAGMTTFLAMAYILIVNPNNILWGGTADPRFSSVFIATALGAFIGTLLMALLAKMPLAQAPGMGLNATVGTIVGGAMGFSYSYGNAMALVFISGIIFLLLSFIPCGRNKRTGELISLREKIFEGIPKSVRISISVGIGLFIAFIGLQNAQIITDNQFTLLQLVDFNNPELWHQGGAACSAVVALFGLLVIGVLRHYNVKGSVIIGIIAATILAIPLGVANTSILTGKVPGISWKFWENISAFFSGDNTVFLSLFKGGFNFPEGSFMTTVMLIVSFSMIDMFDTMGTVIGCCSSTNLMDEDGKPINYGKMMYADSVATIAGSLSGTSTVTTFVESGAGVSAGGRTGLTALTVAILFLLSIFLLPLFAFIPTPAAACALIYVGVLMMENVVHVDFKNVKNSIPAFMTIITMVLSYSITKGIGMGIVSFVFLDGIIYLTDLIGYKLGKNKKPKAEMTIVTIIVFILFMIYFLVPTIL
ncbi:MAG: NCS2 family permease [Bacilli bacterium]|nr:NCS2 family permease [Bacilli bacterium]